MGGSGSDAFLSGQGIAVELARVEAELERLWGTAAQREGGPSIEHPTITRVSLANLVVAGLDDGFERAMGILDDLAMRYPCRVIVLRRVGEDGERGVAAEITARCHLPAPGMPQVCSERIILSTSRNGTDLLPGAVRPLLEAGLPVVLWWREDPRRCMGLFTTLARESSRVIVDLPDPDTEPAAIEAALDPTVNPYIRDLCWFGITRWRELVAQFFDPMGAEAALRAIRGVRIDVSAPRVDRPSRVGAWLGGWLAGQLGWQPVGRPCHGPGIMAATFESESGRVALEVRMTEDRAAPICRIRGVELHSAQNGRPVTFQARRADQYEVRVEVEGCTCPVLPRRIQLPEYHPARRLAAGLESARVDPPYRQALPIALWLLDPELPPGRTGA
jgi:glucose-6-phosphate dehydrogenase assembly protein OpcA